MESKLATMASFWPSLNSPAHVYTHAYTYSGCVTKIKEPGMEEERIFYPKEILRWHIFGAKVIEDSKIFQTENVFAPLIWNPRSWSAEAASSYCQGYGHVRGNFMLGLESKGEKGNIH